MALPSSPNFGFLRSHDPLLVALAAQAERYFAEDPVTCLMKLRQFGEVLAQRVAANLGVLTDAGASQVDLLARLRDHRVLTPEVRQLFHDLRRVGNRATHDADGTHSEALHQLKMARQLAIWFHRSFGNAHSFNAGPFVPPADPTAATKELASELEKLRNELAATRLSVEQAAAAAAEQERQRLAAEERARRDAEERAIWQQLAEEAEARFQAELRTAQERAAARPPEQLQTLAANAFKAAEAVELDEADTRHLIDEQLRAAGWEVDTQLLRYELGTRPQQGRNMAIAEWPTEGGRADYVLFCGLQAVGVVEAKRKAKDVSASIQQSKRYSENYVIRGEEQLPGGPWGKYRVPFLFATNGRPFLEQLKTKSGIWFHDVRQATHHPYPLRGWYTPGGLKELLKQDVGRAQQQLKTEPTDGLGLRDYQVAAIKAVETALEDGRRQALVAMATGSGKTRCFIGLIYRLVKTARFRRVLFLVDRTSLGEQARDAFKTEFVEGAQTFATVFDVKELKDLEVVPETKLHFATVQAMVKRLADSDSGAGEHLPIDQYDCVVIDECHRGYTLDRDMSEGELQFRDQADYLSKYRQVLDHFDAVKIGLTATPALHTVEIFGKPVFEYTYREAVVDGWLVDHEPPVRIETELSRRGIHWGVGERVPTLDLRTSQLDLVTLPDDVDIDVEGFNTRVVTENFNRVVCETLAREIDPHLDGKTLIFCATDAHADMVVDLLKEAMHAKYGGIDDDAIVKITGASDKPLELIRRFKNEAHPKFVVTVDLLTTGIDVPAITNLVFIRRVRSRILYEQMLGRATRLCPDIGKESFRIFDAVDLYSSLEPFTAMKPVVAKPYITFVELVNELQDAKAGEDWRKLALDQILAKARRKRRLFEGKNADLFEAAADAAFGDVLASLKRCTVTEAAAWFSAHAQVAELLDRATGGGPQVYVSDHDDALRGVSRGYGDGRERPEDYLKGFSSFISKNQNRIPALTAVLQRPRDLTRKDLRELKLALDQAQYSEKQLQSAWRDLKNEDVAASIIGFIRQQALGEPLLPYAERVDRALNRILKSKPWTHPQRQWLERIGKQLKANVVLDRESFEDGAFKSKGGFAAIDKAFDGRLNEVLGELTDSVWRDAS